METTPKKMKPLIFHWSVIKEKTLAKVKNIWNTIDDIDRRCDLDADMLEHMFHRPQRKSKRKNRKKVQNLKHLNLPKLNSWTPSMLNELIILILVWDDSKVILNQSDIGYYQ